MMKNDGKAARKSIAALMVVGAIGLFGAGTASATHTHSKKTGNGSCVLLAQKGAEDLVVLPFVTNDTTSDASRSHPLHVLVHKGQPGTNFKIGVYLDPASDPCFGTDNYLND